MVSSEEGFPYSRIIMFFRCGIPGAIGIAAGTPSQSAGRPSTSSKMPW
jgi:hypothetical protein